MTVFDEQFARYFELGFVVLFGGFFVIVGIAEPEPWMILTGGALVVLAMGLIILERRS